MVDELPEDLKRELGRYQHKMYFSQVMEELERLTDDIKWCLDGDWPIRNLKPTYCVGYYNCLENTTSDCFYYVGHWRFGGSKCGVMSFTEVKRTLRTVCRCLICNNNLSLSTTHWTPGDIIKETIPWC
jgi:hypothetical protein